MGRHAGGSAQGIRCVGRSRVAQVAGACACRRIPPVPRRSLPIRALVSVAGSVLERIRHAPMTGLGRASARRVGSSRSTVRRCASAAAPISSRPAPQSAATVSASRTTSSASPRTVARVAGAARARSTNALPAAKAAPATRRRDDALRFREPPTRHFDFRLLARAAMAAKRLGRAADRRWTAKGGDPWPF